jgi:hypothetical protein
MRSVGALVICTSRSDMPSKRPMDLGNGRVENAFYLVTSGDKSMNDLVSPLQRSLPCTGAYIGGTTSREKYRGELAAAVFLRGPPLQRQEVTFVSVFVTLFSDAENFAKTAFRANGHVRSSSSRGTKLNSATPPPSASRCNVGFEQRNVCALKRRAAISRNQWRWKSV